MESKYSQMGLHPFVVFVGVWEMWGGNTQSSGGGGCAEASDITSCNRITCTPLAVVETCVNFLPLLFFFPPLFLLLFPPLCFFRLYFFFHFHLRFGGASRGSTAFCVDVVRNMLLFSMHSHTHSQSLLHNEGGPEGTLTTFLVRISNLRARIIM